MSLTYEPKFIKESVIDMSYEKFDMMVKLNLFKIEKDIGFVPGYKQISKVLQQVYTLSYIGQITKSEATKIKSK